MFDVVLYFEAHQPTPPSSSPPVGESSLVMCHVLKLTNPLPPPVVLLAIIIYVMLWVQWGGVSQCGWGKCQLVGFVNVLSIPIFPLLLMVLLKSPCMS